MTPEAGKIVAEYQTRAGVVRISDVGFAGKTPEQRERDRQYARTVARDILMRAAQRGTVETVTPEEWRQRYG